MLLFHTIKHLRSTQIYHQIWYRLKNRLGIQEEGLIVFENVLEKNFQRFVYNKRSYLGDNIFRFINLQHHFDAIDWNCSIHQKLWTYNLNYFDYINQQDIGLETALVLIRQYVKDYHSLVDGKEPYPTSLRIINLVKFMLSHKLEDTQVAKLIAKDAYRLQYNLEYHLLANHLLENAFALFFAGMYLKNKELTKKSSKLLKEQLDEQILSDGAHYELSPMYHQLMLFRVLDAIQLCDDGEGLQEFLLKKAHVMLNWLDKVTFKNGDIPLVNDSAFGINPTTKELVYYAQNLGLEPKPCKLSSSGYRAIAKADYECFIDVGNIQPYFQPGHAHADSLSFVLYYKGNPFVIDTGTSTYNIGQVRSYERSTAAHNTVVHEGANSSQVWSGFRVGKRAITSILEDEITSIKASHSGYSSDHARTWNFEEEEIVIVDKIGKGQSKAYIHLHPEVKINEMGDDYLNTSYGRFQFEHHRKINIVSYNYAPEFNTLIESKKIEIIFDCELVTRIKL